MRPGLAPLDVMTLATSPAPQSIRSLLAELQAAGLVDHGQRVAKISGRLCAELGLSRRPTTLITTAALLHDVGRLGPPAVAGRIALRSEHTLRRTPGLEGAATIVRHISERWDGRGGPDGLARDRIPLGSRIIGAADAWDILWSVASMTHDEVVAVMRSGSGGQWDPRIVTALIASQTP